MIIVNGNKFEFSAGMTAADALEAAGEAADDVTLVLVEGIVLTRGVLGAHLLEDGDEVRVLRIISGG